ncbi:hypothetical protein [Goodfellowiella coeruleoviolacea]|nr:hypothetical protein [Goodfellowiella coeruleoviolacea]
MTDRPLSDDCADVADPEAVDEAVGQQLPGSATHIIGIPEPKIGRTAKLDCYFGIPDGQGLTEAAVLIGLATYADAATAQERYQISLDAERADGAAVTETKVGNQTGMLLSASGTQTLIGTLGKTSYLVTVKKGLVPDDRMTGVLVKLAQHALTPKL